jgi:hypothetical protein
VLQSDQGTQLSSSKRDSAAAGCCTRYKLVCALTHAAVESVPHERAALVSAMSLSFKGPQAVLCCMSAFECVCAQGLCFVFAVFCEGVIVVAHAKTQRSTSPGTHFKRANGSCNELLEPECFNKRSSSHAFGC